ncbi:phage tail assembly chaperone [Pseudomonas asplenii]|uniref:phage tail assembly chaperone n=1 Tax=Pseudomonas asplenii TaxID=53407 RepID=UPI0037CBFE4C
MKFFYCFDTASWYSREYNTEIPEGAVEVDQELRERLLAGVGVDTVIVKGAGGMPTIGPRPPASDDQLMARERAWRDSNLSDTDALVTRHRDELEMAMATTLSGDQYVQLLGYRNLLRTWPESPGFPAQDQRPGAPGWLLAVPSSAVE